MFLIGTMHPLAAVAFLFKMGSDLVHQCMEHDGVQKLLKSNEKFDICIIEIFNADAMLVRLGEIEGKAGNGLNFKVSFDFVGNRRTFRLRAYHLYDFWRRQVD